LPKIHESPLLLNIQPSVRLIQLTVFMYIIAGLACWSNALPGIFKWVVFIALCARLWFVVRQLKLRHFTIQYSEASSWEISTATGFEAITILPSSVITIHAVFLHFKPLDKDNFVRQRKKAALILADMLAEDDYRRFIVTLKTSAIKQNQRVAVIDKI